MFQFFKKRWKSETRPAGETLLEALVAISVMLTVIGPAAGVYATSVRTISYNRNDLIAAAIADEGVEMMRNIRDTNFIRFAPKATDCWNALPVSAEPDQPISLDNCMNDTELFKIGDQRGHVENFRLVVNPDLSRADGLQWRIETTGPQALWTDSLENLLSQHNERFHLRLDVPDPKNKDKYPQCTDVGTPQGCVYHSSMYFLPPTPQPKEIDMSDRGIPTPFYRAIQIEYLDLDGDGNVDPVTEHAMEANAIVAYQNGNNVRVIKRSIILTNQPSL